MWVITPEIQALLDDNMLAIRDYVWFVARRRSDNSPVTEGLWSGVENVTAQVIDPDTMGEVNRDFYGVGTLVSISAIPMVANLTAQSCTITASPYPEQVQRLLKSGLLDGLRQRRHTFTLPARFMPRSKPGRTISYTSERNGYINKLFRIDGAQILPNCCVLIDVTECDPEDYDWSSSEFRPPIDGVTGAVRPLPTPIYNFAAEPSSIDDDDGEPRRAAILLKWRNIEGVDFVEYELELSKDLSLVDDGYFRNVALGQGKIAPYTLLPNTPYRVRAKYGSYESGAPFEWSEWIQVKTADIRLGLKDIYDSSGRVHCRQDSAYRSIFIWALKLFTRCVGCTVCLR